MADFNSQVQTATLLASAAEQKTVFKYNEQRTDLHAMLAAEELSKQAEQKTVGDFNKRRADFMSNSAAVNNAEQKDAAQNRTVVLGPGNNQAFFRSASSPKQDKQDKQLTVKELQNLRMQDVSPKKGLR